MKVKFLDVMCMNNVTHFKDDVAEMSDVTGKQLIERGYAQEVDSKTAVTRTKKTATTKSKNTKSED